MSKTKKQAYLFIESKFPTVLKDKVEATHYITFVRDTDKAHKKLKGLFCLATAKDASEGFGNCVFESI